MSQVSDAILDALTHVAFPKGFAQAEPSSVVTIDNVTYPVWRADALVVGSGAAGLRAAVELQRRQQNVLLATAGLYMGTSACSGSDKQTLFTAATAGNGDNFVALAEALASGGAMDLDTAYVEAVGSLHTLGDYNISVWSCRKIATAPFCVTRRTTTRPVGPPPAGRVPRV